MWRTSSESHLSQNTIYNKNTTVDIALFLLLAFIGWISIFSVEYKDTKWLAQLFNFKTNYSKQMLWIGISLIVGIIIINTHSKVFVVGSYFLYGIGIGIMIWTIFSGFNLRGSKSWLSVGTFKFQPAQAMFVFVLLALSKYLANNDIYIGGWRKKITAIAIILLPMVLTIYQSETGLALVYISLLVVLYREGISVFYIIIPCYFLLLLVLYFVLSPLIFDICALSLFLVLFLYNRKAYLKQKMLIVLAFLFFFITILIHNMGIGFVMQKTLAPYQIQRIQNAFKPNPNNNPLRGKTKNNNENYNVYQSVIAIGAGGWFGKGFLNNTQTRLDFVPEQSTDFIICSFAESFGFVGIFFVLVLYLFLLLKILSLAEKQRSVFSRCYAYGFISIVLFHLLVNVGMAIGLLPVIGIPLPFLSYGGGAMLTFSVMYFILVRLDIDRQNVIK